MSKKVLVVPDIHTNHTKAQRIIDFVGADKVVFLGDYFDTFHDNPSQNFNTAIWVGERIKEHPEDEFLIGNHDMQYVWNMEYCSGYTTEKHAAVQSTGLVPLFREKLKLFTIADGAMISHAGLTQPLAPYKFTYNWLIHECAEAFENFKQGETHWTVKPGVDRGGYAQYGGLTWCDWNSFKLIPSITQICGHTKSYLPRMYKDNYCIDTALLHYAVIQNSKVSIHCFHDEIMKGLKS